MTVVTFLGGLEVHVSMNVPFAFLFIDRLLYPGQFLASVEAFRFRECACSCRILNFLLAIKQILNAQIRNFHLFFINRRDNLNQHTVLKQPTNDIPSSQINLTLSILYSISPLPFIKAAVSPEHFAISFLFILDEIAFIKIATRKIQFAISFL